jgi:hypothetical protein
MLRHEMPASHDRKSHWDLMLEYHDSLLTLLLTSLPQESPSDGMQKLPIERLPNHRLAYLDYEGMISGQRGTVQQVARGTFIENTPTASTAAAHEFTAQPSGGDTPYFHLNLVAPTLSAQLAFPLVPVGQPTWLEIFFWQLSLGR